MLYLIKEKIGHLCFREPVLDIAIEVLWVAETKIIVVFKIDEDDALAAHPLID